MTNRNRLDASAEAVLLEQCRRQNLEAFGRIVDAYQSRIIGFVKSMVTSREEAEDVAQEVFVRAFQNVHKYDGRSSLRTWLFRIAYNLCIDHARKRGRSPISSSLYDDEGEEAVSIPDTRWDPELLVLNDELKGVVERAVEGMSEKLRTILLLHDQESLGYEELSSILNIPVGTVKSRLFLARGHVARAINQYMNGGSA